MNYKELADLIANFVIPTVLMIGAGFGFGAAFGARRASQIATRSRADRRTTKRPGVNRRVLS